jgi:hypothetical protein
MKILIICTFIALCLIIPIATADAALLTMKLIKVGPISAVVKYEGREITVRKYYPSPGELLFGQSTNLGHLTPCIGSLVGAIVDDRNGEILALVCTDGVPVIVVPDEFIRLR